MESGVEVYLSAIVGSLEIKLFPDTNYNIHNICASQGYVRTCSLMSDLVEGQLDYTKFDCSLEIHPAAMYVIGSN